MPALVKSSVGSFVGTSEELRTTRWPRSSKNLKNVLRISLPVNLASDRFLGAGRRKPGGDREAKPSAFFCVEYSVCRSFVFYDLRHVVLDSLCRVGPF